MLSSPTRTLHMVRLRLDGEELAILARRRHLPLETDLGYLVHCQLGELFGELAPAPFAVVGQEGRHTVVLAYSDHSAADLLAGARQPGSLRALARGEGAIESKALPASFDRGQVLSFEARVCPVVRMSSAGPRHAKGAEVDAFVHHCWQVGDRAIPADREEVYRRWFSSQLERHGGARLLVLPDSDLEPRAACRVSSFKLDRLTRRTQGDDRKAHSSFRPNAVVEGLLEVTDGSAFLGLLRRGIGRHRAFGFGMLLVKRPTR